MPQSTQDTIGIVGAGAFGVALAAMLGRAGRNTLLWSQRQDVVDKINGEHRCSSFPDVELPATIRASTDVEEFADTARFLVVAVSSETVRERLRVLGTAVTGRHLAVHAIGAFGPQGDMRVSRIISQETPILRTGVIAGPSMAKDLMAGSGTSLVCASEFDEVTREARRLLEVPSIMRLYTGRDVIGAELASALSGAYTIAIGLADGLGVGIGTRAVLITRAAREMSKLGSAMGASSETFFGLAGLGNLLVRSSVQGEHRSPSYSLGLDLVSGNGMGSHGEGSRAARAGLRMASAVGLRVPVLATIVRILDGEIEAAAAAELVKTVAESE
ncbi:MAG: hypothetical protein JKY56_21690 [Kofleriaceae bacterium]|nr:hypothetical protein [Kofleriaceae bacterium]